MYGECVTCTSIPIASVYRGEEEEDEEGGLVGVAGYTQQSLLSGPEALSRMKVGCRVIRGKDWKWGDQVYMYTLHVIYTCSI